MLAQEVCTESVNRGDARRLELRQGVTQTPLFRGRRQRLGERAIELRADAQLHLASGLLSEGDRHNRGKSRYARGERGDDARDELGRFARARSRFDDQRVCEILANRTTSLVIDELRLSHGKART